MGNIGTLCEKIFLCQILADSCEYISRKQKELGDFREDFREKEKRWTFILQKKLRPILQKYKIKFRKIVHFRESGKSHFGF
jgi:hypothetical protein